MTSARVEGGQKPSEVLRRGGVTRLIGREGGGGGGTEAKGRELGCRLGEDEMKTRSSTRTAGGEEEPRAQNEYLEVLKKRVEEARQRERDRGVFIRMRE